MRQHPHTKAMGEWLDCSHCGQRMSKETAFERWIRNHAELDSLAAGIVRFDLDVLLHKYIIKVDKKGSREITAMMFVEVKTFSAAMSEAQRDTLFILNQILTNRRTNIHHKAHGLACAGSLLPVRVWSLKTNRYTTCWLMGGHYLRMDASDPESSTVIEWDKKPINKTQLIDLLTFKLDPHDPSRLIDWRRRYSDFSGPQIQMRLPL